MPIDMAYILDYFQKTYPDPHCFLYYTTPYSLLVAVLLSAQCTDRAVNAIMPNLIDHADCPEKMMALGIDGLKPLIQTIGLYIRKSAYILELSHQLIHEHHGQVPDTRQALMALPGVGRKTANVVLNVLFNENTIPVDTHVARVSKRLGLVGNPLANPLQIELMLDEIIPMPWKKHIHAWLILHGRTWCKARSPQCLTCPLQKQCSFFQNKDKLEHILFISDNA